MIKTCNWTPISNKSKFKIFTDTETGEVVEIQVVERDATLKDLGDKELIDITRIEDQKLAIQAQLEEAKLSGEFDVKLDDKKLPIVTTKNLDLKTFLEEKQYKVTEL